MTNAIASSSARRAIPTAAAPTETRNVSSVCIASFMPCPTSPIRALAGIVTPRSSSAPIGCARDRGQRLEVTPGASSGTQNAVSPPLPSAGSVGRDHGRVIGDAEVRDEQLVAVEPVAIGRRRGARRDRRDIAAGLGLGERERRDAGAAREREQMLPLLARCRRARSRCVPSPCTAKIESARADT